MPFVSMSGFCAPNVCCAALLGSTFPQRNDEWKRSKIRPVSSCHLFTSGLGLELLLFLLMLEGGKEVNAEVC